MNITHLQSSTQIISLGSTKILTDPWLTDGEYYGSWYHYPPFPEDKIPSLDYDYIYVSHIHPDHLSEETFKCLPLKKPVLIHSYEHKFLKRKIEMLGFDVIECPHGVPFKFEEGGSITIYAADNCDPELCGKFIGCAPMESKFGSTQIDTLAIFEYEGKVVMNTNDCPFDLANKTIVKNNLHNCEIDVLLLGYAGAGPYPQCFYFDNKTDQLKAAESKKQQFLDQAIKYIELVKPNIFVPFAGTYVLGSRLSELTELRGVPSLREAVDFLNSKTPESYQGVLLNQLDILDVDSREIKPSSLVFNKTYDEYLCDIAQKPLSYDNDNWDDSELPNLVSAAYDRFKKKADDISFTSNTTIIVESSKVAYQFSVNKRPEVVTEIDIITEPFIKISLDHNLLHRLLRGPKHAHWNNAEIGSHLYYTRKPNTFERGLHHSLCFFHQ